MDLFDFDKILELLRLEPGHAFVQSLLLGLIWLQAKGVRKELANLRAMFETTRLTDEKRFNQIEGRVLSLEQGGVHANSPASSQ